MALREKQTSDAVPTRCGKKTSRENVETYTDHLKSRYVVVLTAEGPAFSVGLDLKDPEIVQALTDLPGDCVASHPRHICSQL